MDDIIGKRFSHWTVIAYAGKDSSYHRLMLCRCDCGREELIRKYMLTRDLSHSCSVCSRKPGKKIELDVDPAEVQEYLKTHTAAEAREKFHATYWVFRKFMKEHNLKYPPKRYAKPKADQHVFIESKRRHIPTPEEVAAARQKFNSFNPPVTTPRLREGINDRSPHEGRRWKYSGQDYLKFVQNYAKGVSG